MENRKILLVSHSNFAEGLKKAIQLLAGDNIDITAISAYVDDSDYTEQVDEFFEIINKDSQYFVFTDLYGGSVNQRLVQYQLHHDFFLVTGMNLPIVLSVILHPEVINEKTLEELVLEARNELKIVDAKELLEDL